MRGGRCVKSPTDRRLAPEGGLRVAIIMDGNGRWARSRGRPRGEGHVAGMESVRRVVAAAPVLGIARLTLFAFSSDNWRRPPEEVSALMGIFREYLLADLSRFVDGAIEVRIIGRRDRLPGPVTAAAEAVESATAGGARMALEIALDYSAREAILGAARRLTATRDVSERSFERLLAEAQHAAGSEREVDLVIRTGGEKRLSDCLLWEAAYAEFVFTDAMWPDFGAADLEAAVAEFHRRERRFGTVPGTAEARR